MITATSSAPAVSTVTNLQDFRFRPVAERTLLPNSTPAATRAATASDNGGFARPLASETPPQVDKDPSAMFAAAVISGALSPTPKTMEELMIRIGTSTIPEEYEARIKDLLA